MDWIKNIKMIEYLGIRRIEILKEPEKRVTAKFECAECGCVFTVTPARKYRFCGRAVYTTECPACGAPCEGEKYDEGEQRDG